MQSPAVGMTELALLSACLLLLGLGADGCPACLARQELRQLSLTHIKEQILLKLGLQQAPNVTGKPIPRVPPIDQFTEQMQNDQPSEQDHDDTTVTLEKVITFAQPHPKMRHWKGKELLYFKFTDKMLENKVKKALLWVFARTSGQDDTPPHIAVYKVSSTDPPSLETTKATVKEMMSKGSRGRWIKVDITPLVSEWFKLPSENKGLAIQATMAGPGSTNSNPRIVTSTQTDASSYVPFLEVHTTPFGKHRPKRTIGLNCPENSDETRCCRYPLTVDFEDFGWDWVIAPKKYEANYCSGECPLVFLPKYPHTHIIRLANPSGTAGPCCAPRKVSSISMLYFDQDFNIIYGLLPGMVVDRCGCS